MRTQYMEIRNKRKLETIDLQNSLKLIKTRQNADPEILLTIAITTLRIWFFQLWISSLLKALNNNL